MVILYIGCGDEKEEGDGLWLGAVSMESMGSKESRGGGGMGVRAWVVWMRREGVGAGGDGGGMEGGYVGWDM